MTDFLHKIGYQIYFNGRDAMMGMNRMQKSFNLLKKTMMVVLAGKMIKDTAKFGQEFSLMAKRTGESIENLSKLRSSFISAGLGARGFEKVIGDISDGLLGLSMGRGEMASRLGMLGISPYEQESDGRARLKTEKEVLFALADWAKAQKDMGVMTDQDILYKFRTLLNIPDELGEKLLLGAEAYGEQIRESAERVGELQSEEIERLKELNRKTNEFGGALDVAKNKISAWAAPVTGWITEQATKLVKNTGENPAETIGALSGAKIAGAAAGFKALVDAGGAYKAAQAGKLAAGGRALAIGGASTLGATIAGGIYGAIIGDVLETYGDVAQTGTSDTKVWKAWENAFQLAGVYDPSLGMTKEEWEADRLRKIMAMGSAATSGIISQENMEKYLPEITKYGLESYFGGMAPKVEQNIEINVQGNMDSNVVDEVVEKVEDAATGTITYYFTSTAQQQQN